MPLDSNDSSLAVPDAAPGLGDRGQAGAGDGATPPNGAASPQSDALASNFGAAAAPQSAAPFMIGDSFGGGGQLFYSTHQEGHGTIDVPAGGGGGPMKIADNSSPLPRCRTFFNYNYFSHAVRTSNSDFAPPANTNALNVNRYTFGWEQCFAQSLFSLELRVPFSSTLASDQDISGNVVQATQFGHIVGTFKALLYQTETWAVSTGLSLNTPTSNNFRMFSSLSPSSIQLFQINDQSIHLQPFLGYLATPGGRMFVQAFAQLDFDTRGNDVYSNNGRGLQKAGTVQDQTLLYLDASVGYWLYRDSQKTRGISGVAPMLELHYTTTLQNADTINYPNSTSPLFGSAFNRFDVLNMTTGISVLVGSRSFFTFSGTAPLNNFPNRFFNGEATVLYSRLF